MLTSVLCNNLEQAPFIGVLIPEDIEEGNEFLTIPHRKALDLGSNMAFHLEQKVYKAFRRKGAHSHFKALQVAACLMAG
jgi:hypothetical protein